MWGGGGGRVSGNHWKTGGPQEMNQWNCNCFLESIQMGLEWDLQKCHCYIQTYCLLRLLNLSNSEINTLSCISERWGRGHHTVLTQTDLGWPPPAIGGFGSRD